MEEQEKDGQLQEGHETTDAQGSFTKIDPKELPSELEGTYKSMQGDYTRKTQELAEARKSFEQERLAFQEKNAEKFQNFGKLEKEVEQWRAWYAANQGKKSSSDDEIDLGKPGDEPLIDEATAKRLASIEEQLQSVSQRFTRSNEEVGKMLRYNDEINDIKTEDPDVSKDELLDFMIKEGIQDPKRAYRELYQDKIIERRAQEKFDEHVKKWEEKQKADMLTGPGSPNVQSSFYKPPKAGKPDAWDKTLEEVQLAHRKSEMGLEPY